MGTYKLWELTSKDSAKDVYELAQMAAELIVKNEHYFRADEWDEEAQTLCYAVHRYMWARAKVEDNDVSPYTHRLTHSASVKEALRVVLGGQGKAKAIFGDDAKVGNIATRIYAILSYNQLLLRVGSGARLSHFYIRAWPEGFRPRWASREQSRYLPLKDEVDIQRQEVKAVVLAGEVVTYHDIEAIPLPDPNPDSVLSYLRKIMPLVRALGEENKAMRAKLKELEDQGWGSVVSEIDQLLHGGGTDERDQG